MKKTGIILTLLLASATIGSAQLSKLTKGVGNLVTGLTGGAVTVETEVGVTTTPDGGLGVTVDAGVGVDAGGVSAGVDASASATASSGGGVAAGADAGVNASVGGVSAGVGAGATASVSPSGGVSAGVSASAGTSPTGGVSVGAGAGLGASGLTAGVNGSGSSSGGAAGADNPGGVLGKDDGQSSGGTGTGDVAAKISNDLQNVDPASTVNVIVQFVGAPSSEDLARIGAQGAVESRALGIVNGMSFSLTAGKLTEVAKGSGVVYITRDRNVAAFLDYATTAIGANIVQSYGYSGAGIGVAVIDSGIYAHPDLKDAACEGSRIVYEESFVGDSQPGDPFGHGTHVAGIVGSNGACVESDATHAFRGVAPKTNLISLRVLDAEGVGNDSAVIAAIQRAIELKDAYNIRVINLSLGRPVFESQALDPLCRAVEAAWNAGIVVVGAAGNFGRLDDFGNKGYGTITSPGNAASIITVGAMKTAASPERVDDEIASYSSKGPTLIDHVVKPDIVAPGNRIISLLSPNSEIDRERIAAGTGIPTSYYTASSTAGLSPYFHKLSGTSMAAPMVSGAVALLLEKEPGLTPDQVKAQLMRTASKNFPSASTAFDETTGETFYSQYDIFTVGAGYLDVHAALMSAELPPVVGTARSPQAQFNPDSGVVRVVTHVGSVWNPQGGSGPTRRRTARYFESAIWGTGGVWGTTVLQSGTSAVWGTTASWGEATFWESSTTGDLSAIWGTDSPKDNSAIWGTESLSGSSAIWGTGDGLQFKGEK